MSRIRKLRSVLLQDLEKSILKLKEGQKELNFYLKEEQAKVALLESDVLATAEVRLRRIQHSKAGC